jgi:hypothetical protein
MDMLTSDYLQRAEWSLLLTLLLYFLMNGAQIFETAVFIPKWAGSPPDSLTLLANRCGMSLKSFWTIVHSIHEVIFIITIVLCWKVVPVRNVLVMLFAAHFAVRVWTLVYFVPNILHFQQLFETSAITEGLKERIRLWEKLNFVRVALYIGVSVCMVPLLFRIISLRTN